MKRISMILMAGLFGIVSCSDDDSGPVQPKPEPLEAQVRVQVAYDATEVAFKFTWKSQAKQMPSGQANTGKVYPGQFHDLLKHNGTRFDRLPSGSRMDEDRVSFMIDKYEQGIPKFANAACAITCTPGWKITIF